MLTISSRARKARATNHDGVLQYRHPWVNDKDGKKGKIIRRGTGKLPPVDQNGILHECQILLDRAPKIRTDAPSGVREDLLDAYFDAFGKKKKGAGLAELMDAVHDKASLSHATLKKLGMNWIGEAPPTGEVWDKIIELQDEMDALKRENERLQSAGKVFTRAVGERAESEKRMIVEEVHAHWEKHFRAKSESQTIATKRRVKVVLECIGWQKRYVDITKADIQLGVKASKAGDFEKPKRIQAIKRFFSDVCNPKSENGLEFSVNPAKRLHAESLAKVQKRKIERSGIDTLDPRGVINIDGISLFIKTLVTMLGFAGLRLSEAAGLRWKDINFTDQTIRVMANEHKGNVKTSDSYRLIKPFPNLWPYLTDWQTSGETDEILFPHMNDKTKMYFHKLHGGSESKCPLTKVLSRKLKKLKVSGSKFALRLRRWYSTTMYEMGYGAIETYMSGHSVKTALGHYVDRDTIVKATKIELVPLPHNVIAPLINVIETTKL